jgi:hypothetical protein
MQALSVNDDVFGVLKALFTRLYADRIDSNETVPGGSALKDKIDRKVINTIKAFPNINTGF